MEEIAIFVAGGLSNQGGNQKRRQSVDVFQENDHRTEALFNPRTGGALFYQLGISIKL